MMIQEDQFLSGSAANGTFPFFLSLTSFLDENEGDKEEEQASEEEEEAEEDN